MTTEDDFQAMLDANPQDWGTRLVFADWLQERGDPRADGYRALGVNRRVPMDERGGWSWLRAWKGDSQWSMRNDESTLPPDWHEATVTGEVLDPWHSYATRRECEDAAAVALSRLPAKRRSKMLAGNRARAGR